MMLTIHGLPLNIKYHDLKTLIKQECNITDFILDNLVGDGDGSKKVRIGVADEAEGAHLSKCLNGFRMGGNALRVMPIAKMGANQPHGIPRNDMVPHPGNFGSQQGTWNTGPNQNNQWRPNQPHNPITQNNFGFQQGPRPTFALQQQSGPFNQNRPMQSQGFGYGTNAPLPQEPPRGLHVVRTIEVVSGPSRPLLSHKNPDYGIERDKPVTINKNHFQGASQFNELPQFSLHGQGHPPNWNNPIQQQQPQKLPFEKPNIPFESDKRPMAMGKVRFSPRRSPPPDRRPSPARRMSPGKRMSPRRHMSPGKRGSPGRRMSPGRRISPGRRMSPGRRTSPGRRLSPGRRPSPGRRLSPGRRPSPGRRRSPIPGDKRPLPRRESPPKRMSPGRRLVSPGRFSPSRRHPDKGRDDFPPDSRGSSKQIRPAYESEVKAPNQAPYSGGYRPSIHENVQYPIPGARKMEQGSWGQDRDKQLYPGQGKIQDDDRRDARMPMGGRAMELKDSTRPSPLHKSRSPRRDVRDRSPIKDRYKRHSPSPRSPRRSWALEKRRSPEINEAPPPPTWPGQNPDGPYSRTAPKVDDRQHVPAWDHKSFEEVEAEMRHDRRPYGEDQRTRRDADRPRDVMPLQGNRREPSPKRLGFKPNDDRFPLEGGRFEPRDSKFEPRDPKFAPRESKFDSRDPKFSPRGPNFEPRDPKFSARGTKFEPRDPKFDSRDPKFETRDPKFAPRGPNFEPRDPKFEPRGPKFEARDPKFEPRDPKFEPRDPKFEPRGPKFESRESKFEPRDPKFEPRNPKFEPRDPKFEPRDPKFDQRGPIFDSKFEPRAPNFEPRDPKFEPRIHKFESREPVFEPRDHKFEPRDPKFEPRECTFEPRDLDRFQPRDPKFEQRESKFEVRDPKFPMRPEFVTHDPKLESRGPNFEPRESKFDSRGPNFEQRVTRFEPRDPKFQPHVAKFKPAFEPVIGDREPQFEPRDPKYDPRDDYKDRQGYRRDSPEGKYPGKEYREYPKSNDQRRHDDFPGKRDETLRRDVVRKTPEDFQKEFDDIYKRTMEFKQKVQELRRGDRNRGQEYSRDDGGWEINRGDRRIVDSDRAREYSKSPHYDEDRPPRHGERPRSRHRDDSKQREPEWKPREISDRQTSPATTKAKRNKAIEDIARNILKKFNFDATPDTKTRITEELKFTVSKILRQMFGDDDVSYIELTVKFNSQHDDKDLMKMLEDVLSSFPSHLHKKLKRSMQDQEKSEIPAKMAKSASKDLPTAGTPLAPKPQIPEWNAVIGQQGFVGNKAAGQFERAAQTIMNAKPVGVPSPFAAQPAVAAHQQDLINIGLDSCASDGFFNLYLCKDDFKPFTGVQAELLRQFLVSEMFKVTERSHGWAPDFTLKGLQSVFRYEIQTYDVRSKDWLLSLDFSAFPIFNVIVYTKEELWYERAAIWLPGHSRCRNIEPLDKLKLQNRQLDDMNIGKWKLIKKIVNVKGTRIYVDMPPSAARALEKHKMMLSYELQKVNVYLKAVAVDRDAFDIGLTEQSVTDQADIVAAAQNSPMPALKEDSSIVKVSLKGAKTLSIIQARKIKEMIIYQLFKYHQQNGALKTDFIKYGFCSPNSLGILPENPESKRWLSTCDIGKLNRLPIVILGTDNFHARYLKLFIYVSMDHHCNAAVLTERLKNSYQGVKGLNFSLWKPITAADRKSGHKPSFYKFEVEVDLESAETIAQMKFQLDYVDDRQCTRVADFKPEGSGTKFKEQIEKYKSELKDSYDVANMDIASSDSDSEDVICLND